MDSRAKTFFFGLQILIIIFALGCVTTKNKTVSTKQVFPRKLTDDVVFFRNLQQVDLDNDGQKDIVALYVNHYNLNAVKIIKPNNKGRGNVVFKQIFSSNDAVMRISNGTPVIIVKERFSIPWFTQKKAYRWNGEGFMSEKPI
jgi:hypothetical protein